MSLIFHQLTPLLDYFQLYPKNKAPFMHRQLAEWEKNQPLSGLKVIHHVPIVTNTLLKIACLVAAGAEIIATNPSFVSPQAKALSALQESGIPYVENLAHLRGKKFDLYFDCGAELYQTLASPRIGAIELTASGDHYYRQQSLNFPVISIDRTFTKQLETVFGSAESITHAITQLTGENPEKQSWLVFGFGKIGRGIAYYCTNRQIPLIVVDNNKTARQAAESFGISAINPENYSQLEAALLKTSCVVTATGHKAILNHYPKQWFNDKILANMGVFDEYGENFSANEILNNKLPVNFVLDDPTPIQYIDPEFYAHNIAALNLLSGKLSPDVTDLPKKIDEKIIHEWCTFHHFSLKEIQRWFIN